MQKRPFSFVSDAAKLFSPTVHSTYTHNHRPSEVKVCEDCQVKHSSKLPNHSDNLTSQRYIDGCSYKDDLRYLSLLTQDVPGGSHPSDNWEQIGKNETDNMQTSPMRTSYGNRKLFKEKPDFAFENAAVAEKANMLRVNKLLQRDDKLASSVYKKEKSVLEQSPLSRSRINESASVHYSQREVPEREVADEEGEEKFVDCSRNFADDLDKVSKKWESNIKNNFEKTAHNILHKHLNKQSLLERDDVFRNRESKDHSMRADHSIRIDHSIRADHSIRVDNSMRVDRDTSFQRKSPSLERAQHAIKPFNDIQQVDKNYLSNSFSKEASAAKYPSPSPLKGGKAATMPGSVTKWLSPTQEELAKTHQNFARGILFEESINKPFKKDLSSTTKKSVVFQDLPEKENTPGKYDTSPKKHDMSNAEEGIINVQKLDPRVRKIQTVQPMTKHDRFLLTSPGMEGLKTEALSKITSPQDKDFAKSLAESQLTHISKEVSYRGLSESDLMKIEHRIGILEENSSQLVREGKFEEALEYLLEADHLIKHELGGVHPQHIYIYYLLGECFLRIEDFYQAEQVIDRAIEKYEKIQDQYEKDSEHFCYFLGLLELLSRVYMMTRNYNIGCQVYTRLLKEMEAFCRRYDAKHLRGVVPHILMVKYNLAECFRNLDRFEQVDAIFYEVSNKFNLNEEEHIENYNILFNIAEYFRSRQQEDITIETLKKIAQVSSCIPGIEKTDPELFSTTYDDIALVLFNKKQYTESIHYYELSFKLKVRYMGMKNLKIGYALLALGKAYHLGGEYTKALQRFSSGLDIIEAIEGRNTMYSANISLTMAKIHFELKEYGRSINLYERSLDIYSQIMGNSHPYCLRIFANLVYVCFECKDIDKVLQIADKSLRAVEEANNPDVFAMLNEIGNIYRKNEFSQEALQFYTLALKKFSKQRQSSVSQEAVNLVYINMGSANFHLRKYGDALQYFKEAAKYFSELNGGINQHMITIYINTIRLYKVMGKKDEASLYFKKATNILNALEKETTTEQGPDEAVIKLRKDLKLLRNV